MMMGIWLPYPNVQANLLVLSDSHLADVVWQGLDCLRDVGLRYRQHVEHGIDPYASAGRHSRMWQARPATLLNYVVQAEAELRRRGIGEEPRVRKAFTWYGWELGLSLAPVPLWWYGHPLFHVNQRSHLIRVDPEHYARRLPLDTPLDLALMWPLETSNEWEQRVRADKSDVGQRRREARAFQARSRNRSRAGE